MTQGAYQVYRWRQSRHLVSIDRMCEEEMLDLGRDLYLISTPLFLLTQES